MKLNKLYNLAKQYIYEDVTYEDIFILFKEIYDIDSYKLLINEDIELDENKIIPLLDKLKDEPLGYILSKQRFLKRDFYINKNVLIPRYETEELTLLALNDIKNYKYDDLAILDMCSGSGCIGISLDLELEKLKIDHDIYLVDISSKANEVAKINKERFDSKVKIELSDLFTSFKRHVDILISNPPYIPSLVNVSSRVKNNEPNISLFGGIDGLDIIRRMLLELKQIDYPKLIYLEIDPSQEDELRRIIDSLGIKYTYKFIEDINHKIRFLKMEKNIWKLRY